MSCFFFRNASGAQPAGMEGSTYASSENTGAWSGNAGPPQTTSSVTYSASSGSIPDAHQQQNAQSSQPLQQVTTYNTTMPSQSPVPSSATGPQTGGLGPAISEQTRPQSGGKETPVPSEEQEQQRETSASGVTSWASLVKKPTKGSQQQQSQISSANQAPMVSQGPNNTQVSGSSLHCFPENRLKLL